MNRRLLALDAGNTSLKAAIYEDDLQVSRVVLRRETDKPTELALCLAAAFDRVPPGVCLIASVVRDMTDVLSEAVSQIWGVESVVVTAQMPLGIRVAVPKPEAVGIDRLLEASEAFRLAGGAVVVATFGSALTVDLVSSEGVYLGGTIGVGLQMGLRALHTQTSLLPDVELAAPHSVLGTDTVGCMQSGVIYGAVGAVDRLCEEFCEVAAGKPDLFLSGGDAHLVAPLLHTPCRVVQDLVLDGLAAMYHRLR